MSKQEFRVLQAQAGRAGRQAMPGRMDGASVRAWSGLLKKYLKCAVYSEQQFQNSLSLQTRHLDLQGDAGKSIYTDFLTFQIIPHLDQSAY